MASTSMSAGRDSGKRSRLHGFTYVDAILWSLADSGGRGCRGRYHRDPGQGPLFSTEQWFDFFMFGLTIGGVYALIALGYTMVYGILRLINFAHGDITMTGAFTAFFLARSMDRSGFLDNQSGYWPWHCIMGSGHGRSARRSSP